MLDKVHANDNFSEELTQTDKLEKQDSNSIITFRELLSAREKRVWLERFYSGYDGDLRPINSSDFTNQYKYIVMRVGQNDVGFAMIRVWGLSENPLEMAWRGYWGISLTYIKRPYRSRNFQRLLIEHLMAEHVVHSIHIEIQRWFENHAYFKSLGLEYPFIYPNGLAHVATVTLAKLATTQSGIVSGPSWLKSRPIQTPAETTATLDDFPAANSNHEHSGKVTA